MSSVDLDTIRGVLRSRPSPNAPSAGARAAVAIVLRAVPRTTSPELLLIRRAERAGDPWSGHIAFPGGRAHDEDASLVDTAVRETREEVGLDLTGSAELLGGLDETPAMSRGTRVGLSVAPFVFGLSHEPSLTLDRREVDEALWVPVEPLYRGELATTYAYVHEGTRLDLPAFRAGEHVVWGMTYKMLSSFFALLRGS